VIFFDPLWHYLNASALPISEPAARWITMYAENNISSSTKTSKTATSAKGTEDHSLPRWATSSHHSLGGIHKRIIAMIEAPRSLQWGIAAVAWVLFAGSQLPRTPSTRSSKNMSKVQLALAPILLA
jgi:hypothetical protein